MRQSDTYECLAGLRECEDAKKSTDGNLRRLMQRGQQDLHICCRKTLLAARNENRECNDSIISLPVDMVYFGINPPLFPVLVISPGP